MTRAVRYRGAVTARHLRASAGCLLATVVLTACSSQEFIEPSVGAGSGDGPRGARHGAQPGDGLTLAEGLLYYVLAPAVILLVVAALVWLPSVVRGNRYRPQRGWSAPPVWFAGPPDPAAAVEQAQVDEAKRGGASGSW